MWFWWVSSHESCDRIEMIDRYDLRWFLSERNVRIESVQMYSATECLCEFSGNHIGEISWMFSDESLASWERERERCHLLVVLTAHGFLQQINGCRWEVAYVFESGFVAMKERWEMETVLYERYTLYSLWFVGFIIRN